MRLPRLGIGLVATAGLLALAVASMGPVSAHVATSNTALTANSSYVSVTPARVADTRTSSPLAGGATLNVQVTGGTSGVPAGAVAAVLNVTAVDPTAAGFLTVFPEGTTMPTVSNLNFAAGTVVPNLVTVGLSATGMVSIYLNTGSTDVVVDVEGYYATPVTTSGLFNPLSPSRAFGSLTIGGAIGAGQTQAVTVAGTSATDGVPASASAVVLNVTAAHATLPSFLTVFPAGVSMPTASNLNFGAQAPLQAIANRVTVGVGTSGQIDVYNLTGSVNVDVDVDGYYSGSGGVGSPFVAITPIRVADTRTATKVGTENAIPAPPPQAAATETFTLATPDIPANAAGVAMNLTAVPGNKPGYLTSYPTSDTTPPVASDVNWTASESPAVPNFTIADTVGTGIAQTVDVANSYFTTGATVDVIADAFGYFAPSTAVHTYTVTGGQTLNYSTCTDGPSTSDGAGAVTYTASGFAAGATVDIALFPSTGSNAPTQPATFTPTSPTGTSAALGQGTTTGTASDNSEGVIVSVNGVTTDTREFDGFVAPSSGSFTFTVDSCSNDGTVPVVWTGPSTTLTVNANGTPATGYEVGIGNATTWTALAATPGDYTVYVQTIDPSTDTFQACTWGIGTCYTFTYGAAGNTYEYDASSAGYYSITEALFASYLSANNNPFDGQPFDNNEPTTYLGDELSITVGASGAPSDFEYYIDVPAAPTAVTATLNTSGTDVGDISVGWTAPVNPSVAYYDIWQAALTAGTYDWSTASEVGGADAPTTSDTTITNPGPGTYEYAVVACENNSFDLCGPLSAPSAPLTLTAPVSATTTGPLSVSTGYASGTTTTADDTNCTDQLCIGSALAVTFNEPVTVGTVFSLGLYSTDNLTTTTLNNANSTATASGDTITYVVTNTFIVNGSGGFYVGTQTACGEDCSAVINSETGVTSSPGTAPWNLAGSATITPPLSSVGGNPALMSDANPGLSIVFEGSNAADLYDNGPTIDSVTTGAAGVATVTVSCQDAGDTVYVYDAAGNAIGSVAACTGAAQTITSSEALASGGTVQANEYYVFTGDEPTDYYDVPTMTSAYLIP
jgi:hypothetical protein